MAIELFKKGTSLASAVAKDSSKPTGTASATETLMVVLDTSGSMRTEVAGARSRMHAAISAGDGLIAASSQLSHIGAVAFNSEVAEIIPPNTIRGLLREKLPGFHKHEGGTAFAPALKAAIAQILVHRWGTVKRIIFLSDGEDMGDLYDLNREVEVCVGAKIIIDTVFFGDTEEGQATLKMMSDKTGGIFVHAKDADQLRKSFLALEAGVRGLLPKS